MHLHLKWSLPLFCKPPPNESSCWLLIGQDYAIPRDCLAEAERPCFHSQKRWYDCLLFHSHKSLNLASFRLLLLLLLLHSSAFFFLPPPFCFTEAVHVCPRSYLPFWFLRKKADVAISFFPPFFYIGQTGKREMLGGTAVLNLQSRVREEAAYEWVWVSQPLLYAPEDIFTWMVSDCLLSTAGENKDASSLLPMLLLPPPLLLLRPGSFRCFIDSSVWKTCRSHGVAFSRFIHVDETRTLSWMF